MCIGRSSPLDGVFIDNFGDCKVIEIRHLSDEMKDKIKKRITDYLLRRICTFFLFKVLLPK